MTYFPRPEDTPAIREIGQETQRIEREVNALRAEQRRLLVGIDELRLAQKPTWPNDRIRAGIAAAAEAIKAEAVPSSHHGDPAVEGDHTVKVDGRRAWLSIQDNSPMSAVSGSYLWSFSDGDLDAFFAIVESHGLKVDDYWRHRDGVSIIAHPTI